MKKSLIVLFLVVLLSSTTFAACDGFFGSLKCNKKRNSFLRFLEHPKKWNFSHFLICFLVGDSQRWFDRGNVVGAIKWQH